MDSRNVTVAAVATVVADQGGSVAPLMVLLQNNGAQTVYLGGANVSAVNGYHLAAGATVSLMLFRGDKLYGIVAATTASVAVIESLAEGGSESSAAVPDLATVLGFGRDAGSQQILDVADPTTAQGAATKAYVDAEVLAKRTQFGVAAGAGANTNIAMPGVKVGDTLVQVLDFATGASPLDRLAHATVTAPNVIRISDVTTGHVIVAAWFTP